MTEENKHFVGRTIKEVRLMTVNEQVAERWWSASILPSRPPVPTYVIVLDDGTAIYAQTPLQVRRADGVKIALEEEK